MGVIIPSKKMSGVAAKSMEAVQFHPISGKDRQVFNTTYPLLIIVYHNHNHGNGTKKPGTIVVWYNGSTIVSWLFTMVVFHPR